MKGLTRPGLKQWWLDRSIRVKGTVVVAVPVIALICIVSASIVLQNNERQERTVSIAASNLSSSADQILTDTLNAETGVRGYVATGDPVFIDFTAAWCLSCQVNERAVLKSKDVEKALEKNHVQLLKADWTQYDPVITRELAAVGRSGVPTYVIYPPGKVSNADVLPEFLTKAVVLTAIQKDSKALGTE